MNEDNLDALTQSIVSTLQPQGHGQIGPEVSPLAPPEVQQQVVEATETLVANAPQVALTLTQEEAEELEIPSSVNNYLPASANPVSGDRPSEPRVSTTVVSPFATVEQAPVVPVEVAPLNEPVVEFNLLDRLTPDKKGQNHHIERLETNFRTNLTRMLKEAPPHIRDAVFVNSGFRDVKRQKELWDEAVAKYGSPEAARKWVAPPGFSKHNHGYAVDLKFETKEAQKWVHENAAKYGLHFPMSHEPWHIEPRGSRVMAQASAPANTVALVRQIAQDTGVPESYLLGMTQAESGFRNNAKPATSSALGPHQFVPQTWLSVLKTHGPRYGFAKYADAIVRRPDGSYTIAPGMEAEVLNLRTDWRASTLMAAAHTVDNLKGLQQEFNQAPNNTDLYFAHFLGLSGAKRFLRGLRTIGSVPAHTLAQPEQVAANRNIFFDGNRARSAREVYDLMSKKIEFADVQPDLTARTPINQPYTAAEVVAPPPPPISTDISTAAQTAYRLKHNIPQASYWQTFGQEFGRNLTNRAFDALQGYTGSIDPNFDLKPYLDELIAGVDPQYHGRFANALSLRHAYIIREQALKETQLNQTLADLGWKGTSIAVLNGLVDPASLAIGVSTGGLASTAAIAARLGWVGSKTAGFLGGAAGNVLIETGLTSLAGDEVNFHEVALAAAIGGILGGAFGPVGRNIHTAREAQLLVQQSENWKNRLASPDAEPTMPNLAPSPQSVGAAVNLNATPQILSDPSFRAVQQSSVVETGLDSVAAFRISEGGKAAASPSPIDRMIGSMLGVDTVGKRNYAVNKNSADQEMVRLNDVYTTPWRNAVAPAYTDWATAQGYNRVQRMFRMGWEDFNAQVTRYVREPDPIIASQYPEPVRRAGDVMRNLFKRMAEDEHNPSLTSPGAPNRPVAGAETLTPDPNYVFRVWAAQKIDAALERFGFYGVRRAIAGAIKIRQPTIDDDLAEKFAEAIIQSPKIRAIGVDDDLERIFRNADSVVLADILRNQFRFTEDEIRRLLKQLRTTEPNTSGHFKHRIQLDEQHVERGLPLTNGAGTGDLALSDLLENNADALLSFRARKAAGRVALARQRFVNPLNGEITVDGITSDAEFDALLHRARQWYAENGKAHGISPEEAKQRIDGLKWMYDRIVGYPDPAQLNDWAQWGRILRNFNFARLGGQMGFAELLDIGLPIGALGIRAFLQHMHMFRRVRNANGVWVQRHGLDAEAEAAWGFGADDLRGVQALIMENAGALKAPTRGRFIDKTQEVTSALADVTATVSGIKAIHSWLELVTARMIAQKFANLAAGGKISRADLHRLRYIGLDDQMLDRVILQARTHFTTEPGFLFQNKVTRLNLANWTDVEARAAFERAVFRWSRHIVQENDIGSMHRWMSHPMAQLLTQFRSFALTAWENQLMNGIHHRDGRAATIFLTSLFSGAIVYTLQTMLQSLGRSDADEFVEKRLGDPMKFGLAVFQRAGFSSLVPMIIDTGLLFTPVGGVFDARTTQQPSDVIFGNPATGLISDAAKASKTLMSAVWNGEVSQQDLRNIQRVLVLQNTMPFVQLFSSMISGLPEK